MKKLISLFYVLFLILLSFSCHGQKNSADHAGIVSNEADIPVLNSSNSLLDFSSPKKLEFAFKEIPRNSSLVIEYVFNVSPSDYVKENFSLVMETETASWNLPFDLLFLGVQIPENAVFHYAAPLDNYFNGNFNISLNENNAANARQQPALVLEIRSLSFTDQWYGYVHDGNNYYLTPYVSRRDNGSFIIETPDAQKPFELTAELGQRASAEIDRRRFTAAAGTERIYIPPSFINPGVTVALSGDRVTSFRLSPSDIPFFPAPIAADPGLVLDWPLEKWRSKRWEVFRWELFPSILIIDTADYEVQDRLLKRLAFFAEKTDFRGRLSHDNEFAGLHGWNAHDYRAQALADFYDMADKTGFPLNEDEILLKSILFNTGIIRQIEGGIVPGEGGIISISRQSGTSLRRVLIAHEGFHGIFYADEEFSNFSQNRWERLNQQARGVLAAFLDYNRYDTSWDYLVLKEFTSYILQRPVAEARYYFGNTLPGNLEGTRYANALPPKDRAANSWPDLASAFYDEAQAFSAYINQRWSLTAGRVWTVTVTAF